MNSEDSPGEPRPVSTNGRRKRRRNLTSTEIGTAAEAMLARGQIVSVPSIRAALGGGSPKTIRVALQDWRSRLAERLREGAEGARPIPTRVRAALEAVWTEARADADRHRPSDALGSAGERDALLRALEGLRGEFAREQRTAEERIAALGLQLENLRGLLELERRRNAVAQEALAAARASEQTLRAAHEQYCHGVEQELKALRVESAALAAAFSIQSGSASQPKTAHD